MKRLTCKERQLCAAAAQQWPKGTDENAWALDKRGRCLHTPQTAQRLGVTF